MRLFRRLGFLLHQRELAEEMRVHEEMRRADGLDARGFGNDLLLREQSREAWGWMWLSALARDLRFALRTLRRSPGFAAVAMLSLAIGIGANTAAFSLGDALYQHPLPVPQPQRLFTVYWSAHRWRPHASHSSSVYHAGHGRMINSVFPLSLWQQWRSRAGGLAGLAGFQRKRDLDVGTGSGAAEEVTGLMVSGNFDRVLGLKAALGRGITAADNQANAPLAVEISYALWQSRFGGQPSVLGRAISINGLPAAVVGVSQRDFTGLAPMAHPAVLLPLSAASGPLGSRLYDNKPDAKAWWVEVIGRRRAGVTPAEVHAAYSAIFAPAAAAVSQSATVGKEQPQLLVESAAHGVNLNARSLAPMLLLLRCFAGLVLLIALVNLANLLLARTAARRSELAVRTAIGAGRGAIVWQLATEGLVLGILGGIVALPLALGVQSWIEGVMPRQLQLSLDLDGRVLVLTALVAVGAGLVLGFAAAWRAQHELQTGLKQAAGAGAHRRVAKTLLGAQVALCLAVLAGAGLLLRTLHNFQSAPVGFDGRHITTFAAAPGNDGYSGVRLGTYYTSFLARLRALPGIAGASTITNLPGTDNSDGGNTALTSELISANENTFFDTISPGFFALYRIRLLAGRDFSPSDNASSLPVAIINRKLAQRFSGNPVGRKLYEPPNGSGAPIALTVVGVAANAAYAGITQGAVPVLYTPLAQSLAQTPNTDFVLQSRLSLSALGPEIHRIAAAVGPSVPVTGIQTQREAMAYDYLPQRILAGVSLVLGAVVLLLAAIGLYGLLAFALVQRTREIGIRMALGASGASVARLLVRDLLLVVGIGIACGLGLALALGQLLASLMYHLSPHDPATLAAAAVFLAVVVALAAAVPARRAMRLDPALTLRQE